MKKYISIIVLVILSLIVVGCDGMNIGKVPDTLAFQDEFTREFMASTKEVEDGYYLFESKTGGYTMLWAVNAKNSKMAYEKHKNYFEFMHFGESNEEENIVFFIRSTYEEGEITEDITRNLNLLSEYEKYQGDYYEEETPDSVLYLAEFEHYVNKAENGYYYVFIGYVKSKESKQGIRFSYSSACKKEDIICQLDKNAEREKAKKIMKSVKFK